MAGHLEEPFLRASSLVLYDNPQSIHAQYARIALEETQNAIEKVHINLPLGNLHPTIARMSPSMSVPILLIHGESAQPTLLCDSRDIAMYAARLPGGEGLIPTEKRGDVIAVLDAIYGCNGGQLAFAQQGARSFLFSRAIALIGTLRSLVLRWHRKRNPGLAEAYDAKLRGIAVPTLGADELAEKATRVAALLDDRLRQGGGPWLLGREHTLADSVASVWMQWVVWSGAPVPFSTRSLDLLRRARERDAWLRARPSFVISYLMLRLRVVALLGVAGVVSGVTKLLGLW